jgi:hypothetical protein
VSNKPPKKSETLEVRLSHEAKLAFMERCREDRRTASEAIRLFIDGQIDPRPVERRPRVPHWRMIAAVVAGAALGMGAAAPSLARASDTSHAVFEQIDRNHDGVLSYDEFRAR